MFANSSAVHSNQSGPHPRLVEVLRRHRAAEFRAPLLTPTWWPALLSWWQQGAAPMLDLGCGCGESVQGLRSLHPDRRILGIDASLERLHRGGHLEQANTLRLHEDRAFLHGDAVGLVRLLASVGLRAPKVWLLYPNPWPKAAHLQRRWHGHAVFPQLLEVAAQIELRSNWPVYAAEFATALDVLDWEGVADVLSLQEHGAALSLFERKYAASAHVLTRVRGVPRGGCPS